jgi:dihydrofolate synthase/folylpolyglutamate synthase
MDYQQTIDYLYNTLPMFSRMGSAAFKKDLTNTLLLCERLGNPHQKFKSIHVAGTNGKGSVSHMLAAVLQTAGYKTGLYTSPHLYDFRERIKVNGTMCEKDFVVDFVERIQPSIKEIQPSFFEITVAVAFDYFARQKVDVAVIEVGLGGRLDSTNVITPELSIITNIGWDHMNMLGNSLQEIAFEKAGIIKKNIPVVIGEVLPETKTVFEEKAREKNAELYYAETNFRERAFSFSDESLQVNYERNDHTVVALKTDLPGIYQVKNVRTVLTAIQVLKQTGWQIDEAAIKSALQNVKKLTGLLGRWEIIRREPTVILEVAHNKDGVAQMLQHLQKIHFDQLHLIIGMVKDKEVEQVLQLLPANAIYYFTQAHIPRALDASLLKETALRFSLKGSSYDDVNTALQHALTKASKDDLIIVCGSIFLVAEADRRLPGLNQQTKGITSSDKH